MCTLANHQENIDVPVIIATCSSDFIAILCGEPYSVVTQLRDNASCKSSFLEVHLTQGGDFLGALGVYLPFSRTMHVVLPWAWPSHGSYLSQGLPAVALVLHMSGYSLLVLNLWP